MIKKIKDKVTTKHKFTDKSGYSTESTKDGLKIDPSQKIRNQPNVIGMGLGTTLNCGDYESLRIDVWASVEIQEGETFNKAMGNLSKKLNAVIQNEIESKGI